MKKILIGIAILLLIIGAAIGYSLNIKMKNQDTENNNSQYEEYLNVDVRGSSLVSLMNKIIDQNDKNGISKNDKGIYAENDTNSLKVYVKFVDRDELFEFEKINNLGMDQFAKNFSSLLFRCYKIEYHDSTGLISKMYFQEVQ